MEKIKSRRKIDRALFTRHSVNLNKFLEEKKYEEARAAFASLEQYFENINAQNEEVMECMLDNGATEEELEQEALSADEYRSKYELLKVRCLKIDSLDRQSISSEYSANVVQGNRKIKLPTIEFRKFGGELRDWLPFWNQFQRIHENTEIAPVDKFYYLRQATLPNSRARSVVDSFPATDDNYMQVIEALQERFGREDLLIEVYIRDLLSLTLPASKSCRSLTEMYDKLECHLRALESLGVTTGKCAAILCPLLESCMTEEFLRVWQRSPLYSDIANAEQRLTKFMSFMKAEVQNEERIHVAMSGFKQSADRAKKVQKDSSPKSSSRQDVPTAMGLLSLQENKRSACIFCSDVHHSSTDCYKARDMPLSEKLEIIKDKKYCFICIKPNHVAKKCTFKQKCLICDKRHVILLCPDLKRSKNIVTSTDSRGSEVVTVQKDEALANLTYDNSVLLPTLLVKVRGNGSECTVKAVLDTGSQRSYILKGTAREMNYSPVGRETIVHSLFGGQKTGSCEHNKYRIHIASLSNDFLCNFEVLDQDNICDNVPHIQDRALLSELVDENHLQEIVCTPGPVEILIGADIAARLFTGNVRSVSCGLIAMETRLGWTIFGKYPSKQPRVTTAMIVTSMLINDLNISDLWKLELIGITDPVDRKTKLELQMEVDKHFQETVRVNCEGRYEVQLPWKDRHPPLPSNYILAEKRLDSTVKKLKANALYSEYEHVFKEWLEEGVIERVPDSEIVSDRCHYLPHRHVVKENSTTRIRPVFDASAREKSSPSLNMCLEKGRPLIEQISPLLLRFRLKQVGVVADIRRAFLQISVNVNDRNYLRFLWKDVLGNIIVYRHRRVVFGVVCSPYLLSAVIRLHLTKVLDECHQGASAYSETTIKDLLNCFYVDNVVTSLNDEDQLRTFIQESTSIMAGGKFELRGWEFTDPELGTEACLTNVLGLIWDRKHDTLAISPDCFQNIPEKITKRTILFTAHRVFDPIGFSSPVTLEPKLMLRELWSLKIGWDEEVDQSIANRFVKWAEDVACLKDLKIPRWLSFNNGPSKWSVHTFCDASKDAYAAAVFLRVETIQQVNVQLIQAKTRVSPTNNTVTIPRLELLAALIGARLHASIIECLPSSCESYFWSDSSTVLAWIRREDPWATFVGNRVNEIRKLTQVEQWHHVPGVCNPADLPSRGCSAKRLLQSSWWEGPEWLYQQRSGWPSAEVKFEEDIIIQERKNTVVSSMLCAEADSLPSDWYYRYFSKSEKNIRMIAWMCRFVNNCRVVGSEHFVKKTGPLSTEEVASAEIRVLKLVQKDAFPSTTDPRIYSLQPFEDHDGLLRLRTKISNRPDSHDFRYPVLLPKNHPFVSQLIMDVHVRRCHIGVQGLLSIMRERFWVIGGRRTLRSVLAKCVICKRQEAKPLVVSTPPLPVERVREAAAFEVSGVDMAGPLYLKNYEKAWICLFTCGVTRAVHLELLLSLSTDAFLQAFRRFVARRGRPAVIFSDNGTNFSGTETAFSRTDWSKVHDYCSVERIKWKFNPPTAAWWGGWWERLIGLVKRILRRTLGRTSLTYSEMETVLCDCESVVNSRPLTYTADNTNELGAITPAMFLQDIREAAVPEIDVIESSSLNKRLKYRLTLKENLRKRFRSEYLGQLRQQMDAKQLRNVQVDDVVLIGNDNSKRLDWPLGKVLELLPGKDGVTRLVRLKTASGEVLRPVQRLYLLLEAKGSEPTSQIKSSMPDSKGMTEQTVKEDSDVSWDSVSDAGNMNQTLSGRIVKMPKRYLD